MGSRQPLFSGIARSISVRNTYNTADLTTASGAFKFSVSWGSVPEKSTWAVDPSTRIAQAMRAPLYRKTRRYRHLAEFERAVFAGESDTFFNFAGAGHKILS